MGVRRMLAVWAAKISEKASVHIFHRQGVTWAGKIALKIDPSILHDLAGQVRKDIFIVFQKQIFIESRCGFGIHKV